jgi:hypothetical protein
VAASSEPLSSSTDTVAKAAGAPVMPGSETLAVQATVVFAIR